MLYDDDHAWWGTRDLIRRLRCEMDAPRHEGVPSMSITSSVGRVPAFCQRLSSVSHSPGTCVRGNPERWALDTAVSGTTRDLWVS